MDNKKDSYIFLDIDGVIATPKTIERGMWALTPEKQDLLGIILDKTNAKIVLSSSWRKETLESTIQYMNKKGFKYCDKIIGITIRAYHHLQSGKYINIPRGVEINEWLKNHVVYPWTAYPELENNYKIYNEDGSFKRMRSQRLGIDYNYVILDDDSDMLLNQKDNFIHTDSFEGLTLEDVNKAIEILQYNKIETI